MHSHSLMVGLKNDCHLRNLMISCKLNTVGTRTWYLPKIAQNCVNTKLGDECLEYFI